MPKGTERQIILKHVLCAVDLSSCSVAALSRAMELASLYGAHLDVLHVLDAAAAATAILESRRDEALIAGARCPVLVVPEAPAPARGNASTTVQHIVCAVSSGAARRTLKHAISLALKFGARLTILHVVVGADHNRSKADSAFPSQVRRGNLWANRPVPMTSHGLLK
jgi:nucleotide-binding universal stress UspA family protein